MSERRAVIIGAGPAGLTAAFELLERTDFVPVVLEMSEYMGGLARTVQYRGNRIDIGGHRFFSRSERVMDWWLARMPMQRTASGSARLAYQGRQTTVHGDGIDPESTDRVMLVRPRKSRIYHRRELFDYPIRLDRRTLAKLGPRRVARIAVSYARAVARPIAEPKNLEEFLVNRFGRELYATFFESYTEKVWGVPCSEIPAEWGAQRIQGLSLTRTLRHAVSRALGREPRNTETSLVEQFLYPKLGPGQLWESVAAEVVARGGTVLTHRRVTDVHVDDEGTVRAVRAVDVRGGSTTTFEGDVFFSTMPVVDLIQAMDCEVPDPVREVAAGLVYRDLIVVGLLVDGLRLRDDSDPGRRLVRDNWIYVHAPEVRIGRLQIFNNWSEHLVADPSKVWLGLEYFCDEGDELWALSDRDLASVGAADLVRIGILHEGVVRDATVIRSPKSYPAYFGTHARFDEIRTWVDRFDNLLLIGRNGQHRYNNQDHSMLTAMTAVDLLQAGRTDKGAIWAVNLEQEHHEAGPRDNEHR